MSTECCVQVWADAVTVAFYAMDGRRIWSRVFRGRNAVRRVILAAAADDGTFWSYRALNECVRVFWREDVETSLPRSVRGGTTL